MNNPLIIFKIVLIILFILFIVSSLIFYIYHYKRLFIIKQATFMGSNMSLENENKKTNDGIDEHDIYQDVDYNSKFKIYTNKKLSKYHNDYNYSYTFFIKIDNLNYRYNKDKEIFSKGNSIYRPTSSKDSTKDNDVKSNIVENNVQNPRVLIVKNSNNIIVEISTFKQKEQCIIENIPLQTWLFIGIVLHNKTLDIYINGTLHKSFTLQHLPKVSENKIRYGNLGGFDGSLNQLVYYFRALSSLEILDLFNKNKGQLNNSINVRKQSIDSKNINIKNRVDSCYY